MWVFLVTEVMFFGGAVRRLHDLSLADTRWRSPTRASELDLWLGTFNTFVLLTAASRWRSGCAARTPAESRKSAGMLISTIVLGTAFLGIKIVRVLHQVPGQLAPLLNLPFD